MAAIPPPPKALPDAEFMRAGPTGDLWFVPSFGQYGAVYVALPDGSVRLAVGADYDLPTPSKKPQQKGAKMPTETKTKKPVSKFQKLLAEGSDQELGEHLLATPTLADRTWKSRAGRKARKDGESRADFIKRVLLAGS